MATVSLLTPLRRTDDKVFLLEPIICLCKLALLRFMPDGTKLAVSNHVLYLQTSSCYQWLERMRNGDSRIDISHLNPAIIKIISWYLVDGPERVQMGSELTESVRRIAGYAVQGLVKLQSLTYSNDTAVAIILQYFINLLRAALEGIWDETQSVPLALTETSGMLTNKIKTHFDPVTINAVSRSLREAETMTSERDITAVVEYIAALLNNRDTLFAEMMTGVASHF